MPNDDTGRKVQNIEKDGRIGRSLPYRTVCVPFGCFPMTTLGQRFLRRRKKMRNIFAQIIPYNNQSSRENVFIVQLIT